MKITGRTFFSENGKDRKVNSIIFLDSARLDVAMIMSFQLSVTTLSYCISQLIAVFQEANSVRLQCDSDVVISTICDDTVLLHKSIDCSILGSK